MTTTEDGNRHTSKTSGYGRLAAGVNRPDRHDESMAAGQTGTELPR
jgi:hypothetical protein